ncbi:cyclodeaminase/cyclohydrolase family protein [Salinisphaera orenii]|uniref:Cyclodeaminase/cyclohydrolase domain-containing protein n=1 Tax=Salinisphaera orenii YIM 95161 TaxID=1051139 RepID=A0A423QB39_9GAMM|nr:cyclodeaminase/cyclohydrolase family protein [Salinisphaera halophila]ROO37785.1 hypothetical protein SAHL_00055 [Salinisphaera halophila YIM 95161]
MAEHSLWQMTLGEFRDAIESRSMPGCGAAAASSAAIGLALVLKGLRISESKAAWAERARLIERADAQLAALGDYADEDVQAFNAYLAARRDTAGEGALQAAVERINRVPVDTARCCLEALELAVAARGLTRESLHSDTDAGARLLHSGLAVVLLNVDANVRNLDDAGEREALARTREQLQTAADHALERLSASG